MGKRRRTAQRRRNRVPNAKRPWPSRTWSQHRATVVAVSSVLVLLLTAFLVWIGYQQLHDTRSAQVQERRDQLAAQVRSQAKQISASPLPGPDGWPSEEIHGQLITRVALYNYSHAPVYHAIVSLVHIQGACPCTGRELIQMQGPHDPFQRDLISIPPGRSVTEVSGAWAGMGARPGIEMAFTDANNRDWLRSPDGSLTEISKPAAAYYGLTPPLGWQPPESG